MPNGIYEYNGSWSRSDLEFDCGTSYTVHTLLLVLAAKSTPFFTIELFNLLKFSELINVDKRSRYLLSHLQKVLAILVRQVFALIVVTKLWLARSIPPNFIN